MFTAVLSGGGNHGALEAGALEVFLEAGWKPDLWVGTSAGALNAIVMASDPTPRGARRLQDLWRRARPVPPAHSGLFTVARRFALGKDGIFPNEPVQEYIRRGMPDGVRTFGELYESTRNRALAVALEYPGEKPRIFGEDRDDLLLDGAMASSALPPFFEPWTVDKTRYIDGAIAANLPVRPAVEHGADVILALEVRGSLSMLQGSGLIDVSTFALGALLRQQTAFQLEWARHEGARIHYLMLNSGPVKGWDFTQADTLIEIGRRAARAYLSEADRPTPGRATLRWIWRRMFRRGPKIHTWK